MARTPRASFVAFHAQADTGRVLATLLRRSGYMQLLPGLMWRPHRPSAEPVWRAVAAGVKRRLSNQPFVMVRFVGESPRFRQQWIVNRQPKADPRREERQ